MATIHIMTFPCFWYIMSKGTNKSQQVSDFVESVPISVVQRRVEELLGLLSQLLLCFLVVLFFHIWHTTNRIKTRDTPQKYLYAVTKKQDSRPRTSP